jgi:hypothetical protein|tara:strand:- start:263 stop:976 length:714 start_codon:yes stop_codon:yes gene_type:complete
LEENLEKFSLRKRFRMLTLWNKLGAIGSVASIIGFLLYFLPSTESKVDINNSFNGIVNNGVLVLPVTSESKEIPEENYSPEQIIKSVKLDSIDQSLSSEDRILARSVNGFYYSDTSANTVLFSGITPLRVERVAATFDSDYRLIGDASSLDKVKETVQIKIKLVSMIDNYGNVYEIRSRDNGYIGYAESLNLVSQKAVKVVNTESGYMFDNAQDVQIILKYDQEDVEIVGKVNGLGT